MERESHSFVVCCRFSLMCSISSLFFSSFFLLMLMFNQIWIYEFTIIYVSIDFLLLFDKWLHIWTTAKSKWHDYRLVNYSHWIRFHWKWAISHEWNWCKSYFYFFLVRSSISPNSISNKFQWYNKLNLIIAMLPRHWSRALACAHQLLQFFFSSFSSSRLKLNLWIMFLWYTNIWLWACTPTTAHQSDEKKKRTDFQFL